MISGRGRVLSAIKARFAGETPSSVSSSVVYCAGAVADVSPPDIIRGAEPASLVRGGGVEAWETHERLVEELASSDE